MLTSDSCEVCEGHGGYELFYDYWVPANCPVCGSEPPEDAQVKCAHCKCNLETLIPSGKPSTCSCRQKETPSSS